METKRLTGKSTKNTEEFTNSSHDCANADLVLLVILEVQ